MDNPFDQFDRTSATANPFDQFDAAQSWQGDLVKSAAAGVGEGAAHLASSLATPRMAVPGMGAVLSPLMAGGSAIADKLGYPETANFLRGAQSPVSGGELVEMAKPYVGDEEAQPGSLYDPTTPLGRYSKSVGSALPYAPAMGGVGGAVAMGLGTELGGDVAVGVTGDEANRPYGQMAGAVLSGGRKAAKTPSVIKAPSAASRAKAAGDAYKVMETTPVPLRTSKSLGRYMTAAAKQAKYSAPDHTEIGKFLRRFDEFQQPKPGAMSSLTGVAARPPKNMTLGDLDMIRRSLSKAKKAGGDEARVAFQLEEKLDNAIAVMKGGERFKNARKLYFSQKKAEFLDDLAEDIASHGSNFKIAATENAVRTKFRQLDQAMRRKTPAGRKLKATFSPTERSLIKRLARPEGSFRSTMRWTAARAASSGGVGLAGGGLGYIATDDPAFLLVGLMALSVQGGASWAANRSANKAMTNFMEVAKGGRLPPRAPLDMAQPAIRGAIAAEEDF